MHVGDVMQSRVRKEQKLAFINEMGVDEENTAMLNSETFIDSTFVGNRTKYLNHSQERYNCRLVYDGMAHRLMVQAEEDIECRDELLLNYGFERMGE